MWWLLIISLLVATGWISVQIDKKKRVAIAREMAAMRSKRAAVPRNQFPEIDPDVLSRTLRVIAEVCATAIRAPGLHVDSAKLLPSDELQRDLRFDLDSLSAMKLYLALEKEFKVELPHVKWTHPPTVAHFVKLVSESMDLSKRFPK